MAGLIKRALTRRRFQRGHFIDEEPDETLVYVVKFGMGMTACFSALEIANMAFLHSWNSEVFSAITGLTGIVVGVFVGRKT
ncbi:MAG: hypothetical protein ABSC20_09730 [Candidatus Bathyarchaeia archaeon]|jgi:hypothetical protein